MSVNPNEFRIYLELHHFFSRLSIEAGKESYFFPGSQQKPGKSYLFSRRHYFYPGSQQKSGKKLLSFPVLNRSREKVTFFPGDTTFFRGSQQKWKKVTFFPADYLFSRFSIEAGKKVNFFPVTILFSRFSIEAVKNVITFPVDTAFFPVLNRSREKSYFCSPRLHFFSRFSI